MGSGCVEHPELQATRIAGTKQGKRRDKQTCGYSLVAPRRIPSCEDCTPPPIFISLFSPLTSSVQNPIYSSTPGKHETIQKKIQFYIQKTCWSPREIREAHLLGSKRKQVTKYIFNTPPDDRTSRTKGAFRTTPKKLETQHHLRRA